LHNRHHIQPGQDNDFDVRNLSEVAQAAEGSSRMFAERPERAGTTRPH